MASTAAETKTLVEYRVEDGIAILELNDPPANTYTYEMMRQLDECILTARMDDSAQVIILRGKGEKFFSAGANIKMLSEVTPRFKYFFCLHANETLNRLEHTPKLVIGALNGHTVGGGLEIAMAADIRLACKDNGKIGLPEVNLGVLPGTGGTQRLSRIVGKSRAIEMMVSGRTFSFEEAKEVGLVNHQAGGLLRHGSAVRERPRDRARAAAAAVPERRRDRRVGRVRGEALGRVHGRVVQTQLFIHNEWRDAASGQVLEVVNPATEEPLAAVQAAGGADVDAAVEAARACFEGDAWRGLSARQRGALLHRAGELLHERRKVMAELETRQNGKTLFESKIDVASTVETLKYYGGWADKLGGAVLPVNGDDLVYTVREPLGVVGAIVPWNFPLNLASWKFAPALAVGCTVVLKPAPETPLTALAMAEIMQEAGFPAGAFNVLPGDGPTTGAALVRHPDVDKIAFTGSTAVGKQVMRDAADTVKRVTLELGGKSPNVIFADADLKAAVKGAQNGIFYGKGEVCAAGSRLLVERAVHDQVVEQLASRAAQLEPGDPMVKGTRLGAIASKRQHDKVMSYIAAGKQEATLVAGGNAAQVNGKGYFVEATVFDGAQPGMKIVDEEIFGPVLSVIAFDDVEEAVRLANQTMYGLAAGIWTKDIHKAFRVARAVRAGTVWINTYNLYDTAAPFGGFKASGFGRDLGREALDGYSDTKTVWVAL